MDDLPLLLLLVTLFGINTHHRLKVLINTLKINLNYVKRFSSHRTVNTLHLCSKNESVNAVKRNTHFLFSDSYGAHKCIMMAERGFFFVTIDGSLFRSITNPVFHNYAIILSLKENKLSFDKNPLHCTKGRTTGGPITGQVGNVCLLQNDQRTSTFL